MEKIMSNQENKFVIETSCSFVGGDKSQQGLQEYISSSKFNKNLFIETDSAFIENKEVVVMGNSTDTTD